MAELTTRELAELLVRLEDGVTSTVAGFKTGGLLVGLLFIVLAPAMVAKGVWQVAPILLAFGAGSIALGFVAAKKNGPFRAAPVLAALRSEPDRVKTIRHTVTSDSRRVFESHWISVSTDNGLLHIKANDDWESLLAQLVRRCPGASVSR